MTNLIDRRLVLHVEGAPVAWSMFASDIRTRILTYPDDHADLLQVWSVPSTDVFMPAKDITKRFAIEWASKFDIVDNADATESVRHFPAFIREAAKDNLFQAWTTSRAERRSA